MIDHSFRKHLPKYTERLIAFYKWIGVTPNQISFISFVIACASAFLVAKQEFIVAIVMWWISRILDGTDGIYARATKQETLFGGFLDILCDMASYAVMIFGLNVAFPEQTTAWLIILFLYILCITGALALGSLQEKRKLPPRDNRGLRLAAGLAEGGETGIAYTIFLLLPHFVFVTVWIWVGVLVVTIAARSRLAYEELKE